MQNIFQFTNRLEKLGVSPVLDQEKIQNIFDLLYIKLKKDSHLSEALPCGLLFSLNTDGVPIYVQSAEISSVFEKKIEFHEVSTVFWPLLSNKNIDLIALMYMAQMDFAYQSTKSIDAMKNGQVNEVAFNKEDGIVIELLTRDYHCVALTSIKDLYIYKPNLQFQEVKLSNA